MTAPGRRVIVVLGYSDGGGDRLHPICAQRLAHAATISTDDDVVVLSGWARVPGTRPEAELMAAAWDGTAYEIVVDPVARTTVGNATNAIDDVRRIRARQVVVVTSRWHAPRAATVFRWVLRRTGATITTTSPAGGSAVDWSREVPRWLVLPLQLARIRPVLRRRPLDAPRDDPSDDRAARSAGIVSGSVASSTVTPPASPYAGPMSTNPWTAADIPDQQGRVAVVTGANTGLGLETTRALAGSGATVVMAVRNLDKGAAAVDDLRADHPDADLELLGLDLASIDSIRTAATELGDRHGHIDLLINNAGVMYTPRQQTADGFEMQFGTNHLGHFAWTGLILDRLLSVDDSRVVTVSSVGHRVRSRIDFDDLQAERRYNRVAAYGRSKLANLLFTYELHRRLSTAGAPTQALAAHPGGSDTDLGRHIPGARFVAPLLRPMTQSATMGALPTLRAATDPDAEGGQYYGPDGFMETRGRPEVVASSDRSHELETQQQLWAISEDLTGVTFPV